MNQYIHISCILRRDSRRDICFHRKFNLFILVAVVFALFLVGCEQKSYIKIQSNGMEPTLKIDSIYEVKKAVLKDLKRGDLVVFKRNNESSVKRLIGLPGEKVEIRNGKIYIDDDLLVENYIQNPLVISKEAVTLKENQYFVLGDNRKFSADSRVFGPINGDSIYEQVILSSQ